ncbi:MAG: glycoside hydrolase family 3 N-terminal domain-containing protein [Lachnospiraceae bacterium]|nr:glycoside hydrolase family 3 N-terminal domain-containing protein [Lachnospiraceae bacterium]
MRPEKIIIGMLVLCLAAGGLSGCRADKGNDIAATQALSPTQWAPTETVAAVTPTAAPSQALPTEAVLTQPAPTESAPTKPALTAAPTAVPSKPSPAPTAVPSKTPTPAPEPSGAVDRLLERMTLRQKVGQLFIVCPEALTSAGSGAGATSLTEDMADGLKKYPVGGIVMFGANLVSPEQITRFNGELQKASGIPLLIAVDEEGGRVARLANHSAFDLPKYKSAAAVGAGGDAAAAFEMGSTIGAYLRRYGFRLDFAPVADVNTNPNNPVIGTRAFSSDARIAARMAGAMADGLRKQGVAPTFKHFPGHGDTAEDSHKGVAVSYKTRQELEVCEWLPFAEAGSKDCVMVGHIALPEVNDDLTPATLSRTVVTDILKGSLGFRGLVVTDSLSMGAITASYTSAEAALGALDAGCDLLLMPADLPEAFEAVVAAVEDGTFDEGRLNAIVRRILAFKQEYGLLGDGSGSASSAS